MLYMFINVATLSRESDETVNVKGLVKYTRLVRGYLSYYYTLLNAMMPLLRMIARFIGDFHPNNVIHGFFHVFVEMVNATYIDSFLLLHNVTF